MVNEIILRVGFDFLFREGVTQPSEAKRGVNTPKRMLGKKLCYFFLATNEKLSGGLCSKS